MFFSWCFFRWCIICFCRFFLRICLYLLRLFVFVFVYRFVVYSFQASVLGLTGCVLGGHGGGEPGLHVGCVLVGLLSRWQGGGG